MTTPPTNPTASEPPVPPASPTPSSPSGHEGKEEKSRYRATLNLPRTPFPMKANLVQNEPASLKRWQALDVYARLREARAGRERFVFHDGPPYANGSIHLGHLMNKTFKDIVVRSKGMQGFDVPYVPGWDCHGLPIEHKVMIEMVESGKVEKLKSLDEWQRRVAVRRECQKHAEKYVKLQSGQLQRLLTIGDYADPYLTMSRGYEAATLEVLADLMSKGLVARALKPVHWSIANETALAEAELEYHDREDLSVYVDFEAVDAAAVYDAFDLKDEDDDEEDDQDGMDAVDPTDAAAGEADEDEDVRGGPPKGRPGQRPCFMIWTTTPWTLPANLAIAVNPRFEYALVWIDGNVTVMAADAVERIAKMTGAEGVSVLARCPGSALVGLKYRHPFIDLARGESVMAVDEHGEGLFAPAALSKVFSVVGADYVTLEDGSGLVHTAPGHGEEDYQTGLREGLPVYCPVRADGTYDATVPPWLRGLSVWDANAKVAQSLRQSGHLAHEHRFTHSYPHDWRSKTPTIFRCTEQWFVGVDKPFDVDGGGPPASLRVRALAATGPGGVAFVPEWGRSRMRGMLESRPDWCISRQRAWGLPIPAFILPDGRTFMTPASVRAVIEVVRAKGADAWFQLAPSDLLASYDPASDPHGGGASNPLAAPGALATLRKGADILDVWFESGSSWNAVMRARGLGYPAELYLEGSDQHRGWFQLSLLPALGVTGRPPFKALLTHGFMVDKDGRKLSKSRSDAARYEVDSLASEFGVDVMRWWVASLPYENDVKVDLEFFTVAGESYRKVRNTLRFMLSNLADFPPPADDAHLAAIPPASVDAWALAEYGRVHDEVVAAYDRYDFRAAHQAIYAFCNTTLSAVYLAAVKDRLYCDRADSPRRRRTQAALWAMTDGLCRLIAPMLCHTADEAYRALWKAEASDPRCVHLERFAPGVVAADGGWPAVMALRERAQAALERAKTDLGVENPLDAGVTLPDADGVLAGFDRADLADLLGVSEVTPDRAAPDVRILDLRERPRCERSWKRDGTVRERGDGGMLTDRDAQAVGV